MTLRALLPLLALLTLPIVALAQGEDDIESLPESLDRPRAAYQKTLEGARKKMFRSFDKEKKRLLGLRKVDPQEQLALLDRLAAERDSFEESGKLPSANKLSDAVTTYRRKMAQARRVCEEAYDAEASKLIKEGKLELAQAVLDEMGELFESAVPPSEPDSEPESGSKPPRARATFVGHAGKVSAVHFGKNQIITGSNSWIRKLVGGTFRNQPGPDNTVRFWSNSGEQQAKLRRGLGPNQVQGLSVSRDQSKVAVATCRPNADWCDATVSVWKMGSDTLLHQFKLPGRPGVWTPWFSPDGRTLYAIRGDSSVHIIDLRKEAVLSAARMDSTLKENGVRCAAMDRQREHVFAGASDGSIFQWRVSESEEVNRFFGQSGPINAVDLSSDEHLVASVSERGTASVFSVESGELVASTKLSSKGTSVLFVDSKPFLITGDAKGEVAIWEIAGSTLALVERFSAHSDAILSLDIDKARRRLLTGSADKTASIWPLRLRRAK